MDKREKPLEKIVDPIERYFAYARERHNIYLKKEAGESRPWTSDPILGYYKVTNVFREFDRGTKCVKKWVRDPYDGKPDGLLANVIARWFNRPEIIEFIFDGLFEEYFEINDVNLFENEIRKKFPNGKWVTGAYLVTTPKGMDKLKGLCHNIHHFKNGRFLFQGEERRWWEVAVNLLSNPGKYKLENLWDFLRDVPYQGMFHSHENVIDLRFTKMLDQAPDINTWTNPGPGAQRGLSQIHNRPWMSVVPRKQAIQELIDLLHYSKDPQLWPSDWQPWELHQAEMWACEFFKIEKVRLGKGTPRSIYR